MDNDDRFFSMSITSFGPSTLPKSSSQQAMRPTNSTSDIEGATRTTSQYERYANKPSFLQSDIFGSTSKPLVHTRNTRDNCLYIDDIEGARARVTDKMIVTKRHVNPLQPEYDLPAFEVMKPYEPKFLRHTMDFSDIEGTRSTPLLKYAPRDSVNRVDDIMGAQTNYKSRHDRVRYEREPKDILHVDDISRRTRYVDKTERRTDLMNPIYQVNGMVSYDDPRFTKPRKPLPFFPDSALLRTADIMAPPETNAPPRRQYTRTNYIGDIIGSQSDTIKHSITTNRNTNPLVPVYESLDYGEPLRPVLTPLMPPSMIESPTLRSRPSTYMTKTVPLIGEEQDDKQHGYTQTGTDKHGYHEAKKSSRDMSARDRTMSNTFDTTNFSKNNEFETKTFYGENNTGDDPVLFTDPIHSQSGKPPLGNNTYKLDLEIHQHNSGRGNSSGYYDSDKKDSSRNQGSNSGRISDRRSPSMGSGFNTGRDPNPYKGPSPRVGGEGMVPGSGRGPIPLSNRSVPGSGNNSGRLKLTAREKITARDRQEEINSVRDL